MQIAHPINLRADAAWAIYQILELGRSSRDIMPLVFARHEKANDRAWLQEAVLGVLRRVPTLQVWLRQLLDKPLKKKQKIVEHLIMLGFFQQAFMRTSEHAAVSETVNACKVLKFPMLSGLVNAVMRNFERQGLQDIEITQTHAKLNLPKWLFSKLKQAYPNSYENIAAAMLEKPPLWLRVNTKRCSLSHYSELLSDIGVQHQRVQSSTGLSDELKLTAILLEKNTDVTALPLFENGGFSVQDLAPQHAAGLLNPQAKEEILDACAAPGGKTAAIFELCSDIKALYAIDSEAKRHERTYENLKRLGHLEQSGKVHIVHADAASVSTYHSLPAFDRILLDAPCSATGVIRRHPDIKWHRRAADLPILCELQHQIMKQCWLALKPGGTLLYATCSILPEENTEQVRRFLAEHPDARLSPIVKTESDEQPGWQILPGEQNMDGFFFARLIKSA
ncbi:16S rRNA (cytosine(967)-C(5))-methyltransferase RsmB [Ningiella sp. W23]|uniref:16S rRNA (cytosine(967)-C(5))-methyltransferase RsmB n=1 Tax=Ningiella sp. W23 TaxID=3023715 RepID=UPI0037562E6F